MNKMMLLKMSLASLAAEQGKDFDSYQSHLSLNSYLPPLLDPFTKNSVLTPFHVSISNTRLLKVSTDCNMNDCEE